MTEKCGGRKRWGAMKLFCEVVQACVRKRHRIDAQQLQEDGVKTRQAVDVEGTQRVDHLDRGAEPSVVGSAFAHTA